MPIFGISGLPGAGKTYLAARTMLRIRAKNPDRLIVSNTPLYLPGRPVPVIDTIAEAFDLDHCELLLDEIHLWLDARQWQQHWVFSGRSLTLGLRRIRARGITPSSTCSIRW